MRVVLLTGLLFLSHICNAQFVEKLSNYQPPNKGPDVNPALVSFKLDKPISSLVVRIKPNYQFKGSFILAARDTFYLHKDEHGAMAGQRFSSLIIFPEKIDRFELYCASIRDSIDLYLMNDEWENYESEAGQNDFIPLKPGFFEMPGLIDQSIWRQGLKDPDYDRIIHEVHNLIIHHSSTSNLITDYTSAIRNMYLYHTEVRGWSDIGYNYIIAGNGDIYKGRDPGPNEQDQVMGAHFCSSNKGTLGICLLGTFSDIAPTDTASDSLEKLLVWKLGKDAMDPLGTYPHLLNPYLDVIAGHRDGCVTVCPGEVLYSRLVLMRERVNDKLLLTGVEMAGGYSSTGTIRVFPNPVSRNLAITSSEKIESVSIISLEGRLVHMFNNPTREIDLYNLMKGTYLISIKSGGREYFRRIVKL